MYLNPRIPKIHVTFSQIISSFPFCAQIKLLTSTNSILLNKRVLENAFCHVHKLLLAYLTDNKHHIVFQLLNCRSREKNKNILDMENIASQGGLQLIFRMRNSDPTPQRQSVKNRNILLWFKCVITVLRQDSV